MFILQRSAQRLMIFTITVFLILKSYIVLNAKTVRNVSTYVEKEFEASNPKCNTLGACSLFYLKHILCFAAYTF